MSGDGGFEAIVLAGGGAARLAGIDKTGELIGGRSLLTRVLDAAGAADRILVCGGTVSPRSGGLGRPEVVAVPETPPGGGPAHAVATALPLVTAARVVLLAADLPFLSPDALAALLANLDGGGVDTVIAVDDLGREQYLLAAWDVPALRAVIHGCGDTFGLPLRAFYRRVRSRHQELVGAPPPWWDCDTAEQLAAARAWSRGSPVHDAG